MLLANTLDIVVQVLSMNNKDYISELIEGYLIGLMARERKQDELPVEVIAFDIQDDGTVFVLRNGNKYKIEVNRVD
jgi:hypothetical protein